MQLANFDLNLFAVFETIYREGSLTRAAEALHVTQPTISNSLARMRRTCNDQLFVRSGRGVVPTPVARRMIEPVRIGLRAMQASLNSTVQFAPGEATQAFNISTGDAIATAILPRLMAKIMHIAPRVRLNVQQVDRPDIASALAAGTLDLAIDVHLPSSTFLNRARLFDADYVCVMRRSHPLADVDWTLEQFLSQGHIAVSRRARGQSMVELAASRLGLRIEPHVRVPYYLAALEIVRSTDLVLLVNRALASRFELHAKELPFDGTGFESWVYWHRNAEDDPANRWLRGLIIDAHTPDQDASLDDIPALSSAKSG